MRSSIFSSDLRRGGALRYLGLFVAIAGLVSLTAHAAWKYTRLRQHVVLEAIAPAPAAPGHYLSITDMHAIDAQVYLHGLEEVCSSIQAADVVFFGNSTVQLAFQTEDLKNYFTEHRLRFYLLGFPIGTDVIAHRILDRCDARPRLAVVFETMFFTGDTFEYDRIALESSAFDARKLRLEFDLSSAVRRRLHDFLPHPVGRDLTGGLWIVYRSRLDGTYWVAIQTERNVPVDGGETAIIPIPPEHLRAAERFQAEIDRRGGELILAYVPTGFPGRDRAYTIAKHLDVPLLDPRLSGLVTADNVHLQRESAGRYGRTFLRELLVHLPEPRKQRTDSGS